MPKRIIDGEGVWRSQKLRQVELKYRSEYANLLPLAEDRGSFEYDPASIWADVYACSRPDITQDDVTKILAEFERVKLLYRWEQDGKTWGFWVGIDKAGLLPKPSERHSDFPTPDKDALEAWSGRAAPDTPSGRADSAPEERTGFGLGSGSGSGLGRGNSHSHSAPQDGVAPPTEEDQDQNQNIKTSNIEHGCNLVAITQHLHDSGAISAPIKPNDPCLPLLAHLVEERLALRKGEPTDEPQVEGGLTVREASASATWSCFTIAIEALIYVNMYMQIEQSLEELKPGMVNFSEEDIRGMMKAFGWPHLGGPWPWEDTSIAIWAAVLQWAFEISDYWKDGKLKSLSDVISAYPKIRVQYDKYYRTLPEGKKPHDLHAGMPPLCSMCGERFVRKAPDDAWEGASHDGYYINCLVCDPPSTIPPPPPELVARLKAKGQHVTMGS